jgi:hypothetical protein
MSLTPSTLSAEAGLGKRRGQAIGSAISPQDKWLRPLEFCHMLHYNIAYD